MKRGPNLEAMTLRTCFQSSLQRPGVGVTLFGEFQHDDGSRELSMAMESFTGALYLILN